MTISAWNERRRCFCGSTNVVEAIATTLNPTILTTNPRHNPQTSGTSNTQRTHINWQDSTSAQNLSSSQIPSNPNNPRRNDTFLTRLGYVSAGAFLFFIIYATPLKNLADPSFWQSLFRNTAVEPNSQSVPIPNSYPNKDDLNSEKGLNYTNLQKLLAAGNWFEADKETEQVMLQAVGLGESNSISYKRLSSFPCTDLLTIDNLWKKYSNGRFGFSVQKEIYLNAGGKPDSNYYVEAWKNFGDSTGWRVKGEWIKYGSLEGINFSTSAPPGHLPYKVHLTMGARRPNDLGFFPRMYSCNL
ncbi:hypothetical protein DSM106972_098490 [Dulcicalothrix desertica PCC 7102]|uniref:GUN4-like domain-containing protein n=2 Tax=Dulcicalothrix desertica TaxID=32056 RepID=A0A3S1I613_9CYAN|nr:hypothetical protein DSM106972_098490 [Dulcicalothrix desertica PCC 7102]